MNRDCMLVGRDMDGSAGSHDVNQDDIVVLVDGQGDGVCNNAERRGARGRSAKAGKHVL